MSTRELIEKCRDALAEELGAWDIDPPLFHVKEAHDACVAWLAAPAAPAEPVPAKVWEASSKTSTMLFASEECGKRWLAQFPASVAGGFELFERGVYRLAAPAAPSYLTRDTIIGGVRVIKVWPEGADEPQILGTTIGGAPAAPSPAVKESLTPAPLTDEQIKKLYALNHWHEISHFTWGAASVVVRAVEVAHGITKGGGND